MAHKFCAQRLATIRKQKPELVFTIVGRDPSPECRPFSIDGVEVTGSVDDVPLSIAKQSLP